MRLRLAALLIIVIAINASAARDQDPKDSTCAQSYTEWFQAYEVFGKSLNNFSVAKKASVEPLITEAMSDVKSRKTISSIVQSVLRHRGARIADLSNEVVSAAENEKILYEHFRRCRMGEVKSKNDRFVSEIAQERSTKLRELNELLLDEAYVQYRKESPTPPTAYTRAGDRNPGSQWEPYGYSNRRMGYENYGAQ